MTIAVLGTGVTGIATAWYLRKAGHGVTVIEQRSGPGLETSYANGGQISVSHVGPRANPRAPVQSAFSVHTPSQSAGGGCRR